MKELKFNINYLFHKREFYFAIFIAICKSYSCDFMRE